MTKGLMDRALHHETALERVRDKARLADEELSIPPQFGQMHI